MTDIIESILRDPINGYWTIPVLTFNTNYGNPFYDDLTILNSDRKYKSKIIDYIYTCLTERWLYKDPVFEQLLAFFKVKKSGLEGKVCLITNPEKKPDLEKNLAYKKFIYKYIETFFVTKLFVEKTLKSYVKNSDIKWYDLLDNKKILKGLFAYKIKNLIKDLITQIQKKRIR